jgi:hypothetical protein
LIKRPTPLTNSENDALLTVQAEVAHVTACAGGECVIDRRLIDTPNIPFFLETAALFGDAASKLEFYLEGSLIGTILADALGSFGLFSVLVKDPAFFGLNSAALSTIQRGPQAYAAIGSVTVARFPCRAAP